LQLLKVFDLSKKERNFIRNLLLRHKLHQLFEVVRHLDIVDVSAIHAGRQAVADRQASERNDIEAMKVLLGRLHATIISRSEGHLQPGAVWVQLRREFFKMDGLATESEKSERRAKQRRTTSSKKVVAIKAEAMLGRHASHKRTLPWLDPPNSETTIPISPPATESAPTTGDWRNFWTTPSYKGPLPQPHKGTSSSLVLAFSFPSFSPLSLPQASAAAIASPSSQV